MRTQIYADKIKRKFTQIVMLVTFCSLLVTLCGCEAFVRKFTRKSKKAKVEEEPVLVPEEYSLSDISTEERYRQSFLFWNSWQDELITVLGSSASHKKRRDCLKEAIKNLEDIRPLLFQEKQKELDVYLEKLRRLEREISKDIYGNKLVTHKARAESLKRNISRDFSYTKIKNHLR
jgi:hypothetical protein